MKKTVCFVLIALTVLSAVLVSAPAAVAGALGDINGDGFVDNKDVVVLFRLVSSNDQSKMDEKCDINGDGSVDNKDVVTLFRTVSGGELYLPDETLKLNSVVYDEKGKGVYFDDPEFKTKLAVFSNKIFEMSAEDKNGNYAFSPLSAYMALAVLNYVGDNGVKADIEKLFGIDQTDIEKTKDLFLSLVNERRFDDKLISKLDITNTVWIDSRRNVNKNAAEMLAEKLFCHAHSTPFFSDNAGANKAIREFIAEKTNGLIDSDFDLDPFTAFAIINTLYLKDVWGEQKLEISKKTFNSNGKRTEKDFLTTGYERGETAKTDKARYFTVRTESGYKVKFILPNEGCTLKQAMTKEALDEINARQSYDIDHGDGIQRYTRCVFPKFRVESETDLKKVFKSNGYLGRAFTGYVTDLMNGTFAVSDIIHRVVCNVDETGVEGAAVTIIISKDTAVTPYDPEYCFDFVLDREFGFIITTYDDVILFEGTVTEP